MIQALQKVIRNRLALGVLIAYTSVLVACGITIFPDSEDVKLGQQLDGQIRANPGEYPILKGHPEIKTYVIGVVNTVLASPEVKKRGVYAYAVEIIGDDKTINAFCTPGGYIYVYTGLLKFIDNEATLAGVLGHEIAHAERRHASKRMTSYYGTQILLGMALGSNPSQVEQIAANLFTNIGFMKNSRDDETEADNYSMIYLRSTIYYPGAITNFFNKINASGKGNASALEKLFLTHPPSSERAANVKARMAEWYVPEPDESNTFTKRYKDVMKKLP